MKTRKSFYRALRSVASKFIWETMDGYIRGRVEGAEGDFCPITAVYYAKTGNYLSPGRYDIAASRMGLGVNHALDIIYAADEKEVRISEYKGKLVRRALMRAVGK